MKKIIKYIIWLAVAALFIGTFAFLYKNSRPEEVRYQELEATVMDINRTTVLTGKIVPRNEVFIKPQINGIIAELYKQAGEKVQENEIIAKLKVIPDMNSLSSAQSRVRLSEINLKQAQTNYEREKALYDRNLVSADEFDKVSQALAQAKEEAKGAQDALEVIRDGVSSSNATSSSTLVRSTISGLLLMKINGINGSIQRSCHDKMFAGRRECCTSSHCSITPLYYGGRRCVNRNSR